MVKLLGGSDHVLSAWSSRGIPFSFSIAPKALGRGMFETVKQGSQ